jgi:hypothetical protein
LGLEVVGRTILAFPFIYKRLALFSQQINFKLKTIQMKQHKVKKTDGGFWKLFWIVIGAFIAFGILSWVINPPNWVKLIEIGLIILTVIYCGNGMRRSEENEFAAQVRNGKFTKKYYAPGDNHLPLRGIYTETRGYQTGTFTLSVPFKEITFLNADSAEGFAKLTFIIDHNDLEPLFKLTRGIMDYDALKEEIKRRLLTTIQQALGSSSKAGALNIEEGWDFEQKTFTGEMSNYIGEYLTGVKSNEYAQGIKPNEEGTQEGIHVPMLELHLVQVEFGGIIITGEAYKARQKQLGEEKSLKVSEAKQNQFDVMVDKAIQAALDRKKNFQGKTNPKLTAKEISNIYDQTLKNYRQQNGADMLIIEGDQNLNKDEFVSRYAGNKKFTKNQNQGGQKQ